MRFNPGRSAHYDAGIPQEWGPGPWDHEEGTSWAAAYRGSDLRAWAPGDPVTFARVPMAVSTERKRLGPLMVPK